MSARDIDTIVRMGLVITPHTNSNIYKAGHLMTMVGGGSCTNLRSGLSSDPTEYAIVHNMAAPRRWKILLAVTGLCLIGPSPSLSTAQLTDCSILPAPDPQKTFFQNFFNSCYAVGLAASKGTGSRMTDLDQTYAGFFYQVNPNDELILVGEFPRARYHSISLDDSHLLTIGSFYDTQLAPLGPGSVNPFLPAVQYKEDQLYAVAIHFGGTEPDAVNILPGCGLGGIDIHGNVLDATQRHPDISWNGDPRLPVGFPLHDDAGPNRGGLLAIRQYMNADDLGRFSLTVPVVFARNLSTGCAVPKADVIADNVDTMTPDHLIARTEEIGVRWMDAPQIGAHQKYRSLQQAMCYRITTPASAVWFRPDKYVEAANPHAGYLLAPLAPAQISSLVANGDFLRIRFRLPSMATIPCEGCALTGTEDARYFSLSFFDDQKRTLASLGEFELVRDPQGYVTIIIGLGGQPPPTVTAENNYTYFDLSAIAGFEHLAALGLRMILTSDTFPCPATSVPHFTSEDHSLGGFMGEYAPVVDAIRGSLIPPVAAPLEHPNSCGLVPPEPPVACTS